MKVEDIKSEEQVIQYIEGCLNDMEAGLEFKHQTGKHINDLIIYLIKLDRSKDKRAEAAFLAGRSKQSWESFLQETKSVQV